MLLPKFVWCIEYTMAFKSIEPLIERYKLDRVMLTSIIRGSMEKEEYSIKPASKVWRSKDGNVYSIKPANVKINLSFALENAFRLKTIFGEKDIWLVLAIIYIVVDMFTNAVEKVDELSALVLLALFRLQTATKERVTDYACQILPENCKLKVNEQSVEESLNTLEELKCIKLENGVYSVMETIDSSLYSYEKIDG